MSFPYFRETREGKCLFGTLVVLLFANSGISVWFSFLIRDFWSALAEKHVEQFYHTMYKFLLSMIVLIPLQVSYRFFRVKLAIAWRKWLTERVLKLYFANKVFYGLERQSKAEAGSVRSYANRKKEMDNPDQVGFSFRLHTHPKFHIILTTLASCLLRSAFKKMWPVSQNSHSLSF